MNKQIVFIFGVALSLACVLSSASLLPDTPMYPSPTMPAAVTVTAQGAGWWLVTADGLRGYVNARYLQEVECEP
jgi:hypothetical protein